MRTTCLTGVILLLCAQPLHAQAVPGSKDELSLIKRLLETSQDPSQPQAVPGEEDAASTAKSEAAAEPVGSPREQLSRELLELKAQRSAVAAKPPDPAAADLDARIARVQQQLGSVDFASDQSETTFLSVNPPVYPRIVAPDLPPSYTAAPMFTGTSSDPGNAPSRDDSGPRQLLQERTITLSASGQPLNVVLQLIAFESGCNFSVNWSALSAAGIDPNTPVTLQLAQVPAASALRAVLGQVSSPNVPLGFTIYDGMVVVSTREDLSSERFQELRVYNVSSLVPDTLFPQTRQDLINGLMDTIRSSVAPESWRDNGGSIGMIREFNGLLIVGQTHDNLAAIDTFLAQLRTAR